MTFLLGFMAMFYIGCGEQQQFISRSATQNFVQDLNPEFLDILWMVDDRSPMHRIAPTLIEEAKQFFTRLDGAAHHYRMAFVNHDMELSNGDLKPKNNPVILTKDFGTVEQRVTIFGNIINQVLINLSTGAVNQGFESVRTALTQNFVPRSGVPLVIVFISDGDDASTNIPQNMDAVDYYSDTFLSLKDNNADLLRVYSINYIAEKTPANRCATQFNADIDKPGFENRYSRLALDLNGETGNLCGNFADQINLAGLRLNELKSRFQLDKAANEDSIKIIVSLNGQTIEGLVWAYDSGTREIVFSFPPPEGANISVNFLPASQ